MRTGPRYALLSATGAALLTAGAVTVANHAAVQSAVAGAVPLADRLPVVVLSSTEFAVSTLLAVVVVCGALFSRYEPRPERVLDTVYRTVRSVVVATCALATIGYFDYTYRLPRLTLVVTVGVLLVVLPLWFASLRRWRRTRSGRAIVVGHDSDRIARAIDATSLPVVGYLHSASGGDSGGARPDGGVADHECLGGISRFEDVVAEFDVTTTVVTFPESDRGEFFGVLHACHDNGVAVQVHRDHRDTVLSLDRRADLVDVNIEPLDWQSRATKRAFDVTFSLVGLAALSPLMAIITVAVALDGPGPVFYTQQRTAELGGVFRVRKFRSMRPETESATPGTDGHRVTRVGRVLRRTHLDELPQLWSILVGEMSVVGPRAVWTEEEELIREEVSTWQRRWFVKPGLTGLAQVHEVSSEDPEAKLRADLEYIRRQSLWLDSKIVLRQVWLVLRDVGGLLAGERE